MEKSFLAHSTALVRRLGMSERSGEFCKVWKTREIERLTSRKDSA